MKILRTREVLARVGLSRTTIWRRVRDGSFPPPVKLGVRAVGWTEDAINEWIGSRPAAQQRRKEAA